MFNAEEMNEIAYENSLVKVEVEKEIESLTGFIQCKAKAGYFEANCVVFNFPHEIDYEKACVVVNKVRDYFEDKGFRVELRLLGYGYDFETTEIGGHVSYYISWMEVE